MQTNTCQGRGQSKEGRATVTYLAVGLCSMAQILDLLVNQQVLGAKLLRAHALEVTVSPQNKTENKEEHKGKNHKTISNISNPRR